MDNAFYVVWPVLMLVELIVDIDATLSDCEGCVRTLMSLLAGESRVTLCFRLRITRYDKDNHSTSVYQLLFSHDDKETTLEAGEIELHPHADEGNKPGQIIPTPTHSLQKELTGCGDNGGFQHNMKIN